MHRRQVALLAVGIGTAVLLSRWGEVSHWADALVRQERVRPKRVVYWTSSGSPEVDLKRAREFMREYPDTAVLPNFRETGGLQDVLFASFLSGSPPDVLGVSLSDIREMVAAGMLRPLDGFLERQLAREPDFLTNRVDGEPGVYRFRANPSDEYIRAMDRYPRRAARLLHMHGKFLGFRNTHGIDTLTYNKRLFRLAARMFPDEGLVDEHGEPVPPSTWSELYRVAKVITRYGREAAAAKGEADPLCYGLVVQGQRPYDLMRGIRPLAARAGSMGFDFAGKRWVEGVDRRVGRFEYEHPGFLGAFALLLKLKREGCILPGAESRHYEDVRTELASGHAAMLIDGWHAALIGAERVPWAAKDLGSAPVPVPDAAAAELLGLDRLGIRFPREANKQPRAPTGKPECITSLARSPEAAWHWLLYRSDPQVVRSEARRGVLPVTYEAARHLDDPEWFPYPYQKQVWAVLVRHCQMWPEPPIHGQVRPTQADVFRKYFYQTELDDLGEIVRAARREVMACSRAANADLARRVRRGEVQPDFWTFPAWDPRRAREFFDRQRAFAREGELAARIEALKRKLPPRYRTVGTGYEPQESPWQFLWIPGLMLAVVCGYVAVVALRPSRSLGATAARARAGWEAYVFVVPALLALFAFVIYPAFYQLYLSLHRIPGIAPPKYVGWANFRRIFAFGAEGWDAAFWAKVLPNTVVYMVVVTGGQIAIGLVLASLLNLPLRANRVYRVFYFVPLVTSLAIVSVIFLGLFSGTDSGLNQLLDAAGLRDLPYWLGLVDEPGRRLDWLGSSKTDLGCVVFVGMWHGLPYTVILLLAGLQSVSPTLYDAAKVDGAGPWQRFWHVTIPELLPILIVIVFNALIGAARAFSAAYVLTEGGADHSSELVSTYIFKLGFTRPEGQEPDLGYASALGVVYALLLGALTAVNVWVIARRWRRRQGPKAPGGPANA
ncbi:MAG: extracellular solute-binding protein [Candidatus Brocadiia bacterium]